MFYSMRNNLPLINHLLSIDDVMKVMHKTSIISPKGAICNRKRDSVEIDTTSFVHP